jgi:hypothetical protein
VTVVKRVYAHREHKELLVVELNVTGSANTPVLLSDKVFQSMVRGGIASSPDVELKTSEADSLPTAEVVTARVRQTDKHTSNVTRACICRDIVPTFVSAPGALRLLAAHVVGGNDTSLADLEARACGLLAAGREESVNEMYRTHRSAWAKLWAAGVKISGNPPLARLVNATMYGVLSALREDVDYSTSPGGLVTNGYNGHVFWDMDTWIFPTLNLFAPSLADSHLRFRLNGVQAATEIAHANKHEGLMFPWEATPNGYGASRGDIGPSEPHVTGDIAVAFWNRWRATHDLDFLQRAFPVLEGVANFWSNRSSCSNNTGCWIRCVAGPDEFHFCKDHEVYTTAIASTALQIALQAVDLLHLQPTNADVWRTTERRLTVNSMTPPGRAGQPNVTECYAGYVGEAVMQPAVADVGYPLMWAGPGKAGQPLNATQRGLDLDFYWKRTSGFIAGMTWPAVSIGYNELNNTANADLFFAWAYGTAQAPFNTISEEPGGAGCPNFLTGGGGLLQAVWAGWGGVRLRDDRLDFVYPTPPPGSTAMQLSQLSYRGHRLDVDIGAKETTVVVLSTRRRGSGPASSLTMSCNGGATMVLTEGVPRRCREAALVTIAVP